MNDFHQFNDEGLMRGDKEVKQLSIVPEKRKKESGKVRPKEWQKALAVPVPPQFTSAKAPNSAPRRLRTTLQVEEAPSFGPDNQSSTPKQFVLNAAAMHNDAAPPHFRMSDTSVTQQSATLDAYNQAFLVKRPSPRQQRGHNIWFLFLMLIIAVSSALGGAYVYRTWYMPEAAPNAAILSTAASSAASGNVASSTNTIITSNTTVIARAVVKPERSVMLAVPTGGRVHEVLVREGEMVSAGQPLVRLDDQRQVVAIAQANAAVQQAEAHRLELAAGARAEEIAAAQAVVDAAQARLNILLDDTVSAADETAAAAAVIAAQAKLNELYNGPSQEALIVARAEMQKAEAALSTARSAYNAVRWRNDIGMLPESAQLQQATIAFEAAKAQYDELTVGPNNAEISAALAEIEGARATLARVETPAQASEIEAARAELRQAQAQLELLRAGTRNETLAAAAAAVNVAQATLIEAQIALADTVLSAPFSGIIAALDVEEGEMAVAGATVIHLGDIDAWHLETDDLIELDMVRVQPGAPVAITVDALPDLELLGTVARVKPIGEDKLGDMTYTVYIELDEHAPELAWNMTATVYIGEKR